MMRVQAQSVREPGALIMERIRVRQYEPPAPIRKIYLSPTTSLVSSLTIRSVTGMPWEFGYVHATSDAQGTYSTPFCPYFSSEGSSPCYTSLAPTQGGLHYHLITHFSKPLSRSTNGPSRDSKVIQISTWWG